MYRRRCSLLAVVLFLCTLLTSQLHAEDGIPDNCETASAERLSLFARYEPQNRRLMLVDWNTGADVQIIASDIATASNLYWSPDCRYLSAAIATDSGWDTVVFDVTTGTTVGKIADAQGKPHPVTWGPSPYLMVETRAGGILWNVATNTQITVTTGFNKTTYRNFNRLRWDAASNQVVADLAVGGREVYDLTTGQRIPEAANVFTPPPYYINTAGSIVIGGKAYDCEQSYWNIGLRGLQVVFDYSNQSLALELATASDSGASLQMIEGNLNAAWVRFAGGSPSCRYFAAHVGIPGENASDTVVWDIVENRRVGVFEDAREVPHPLRWSDSEESLFIQTRNGAYLWYIPTNTRTLITTDSQEALTGWASFKNVENYNWALGKLLIRPLGSPEEANWLAYDAKTGQLIGETAPPPPYQYTPVPRPPVEQTLVPMNPIEGTTGYSTYDSEYHYSYWSYDICGDRMVRYIQEAQTLQIEATDTREVVQTLANDLIMTAVRWSPDCKWVVGIGDTFPNQQLGYDNRPVDDLTLGSGINQMIIWNTQQSGTAPTFILENPYVRDGVATITWSPGLDRAIAYTGSGSYLLNLQTGDQKLLTFKQGLGGLPRSATIYWDYSRGQVLISGSAYNTDVLAFDLLTGMERYRFAGASAGYSWSRVSAFSVHDNKTLFITGDEYSSIWIWDLDTLDYSEVSLASLRQAAFNGDRIALSPDGRYLVMGYENLRVWDLTNLAEELTDREPIAAYPVGEWGTVVSVRFINNVTVEITSSDGGTRKMNVETGEVVATS